MFYFRRKKTGGDCGPQLSNYFACNAPNTLRYSDTQTHTHTHPQSLSPTGQGQVYSPLVKGHLTLLRSKIKSGFSFIFVCTSSSSFTSTVTHLCLNSEKKDKKLEGEIAAQAFRGISVSSPTVCQKPLSMNWIRCSEKTQEAGSPQSAHKSIGVQHFSSVQTQKLLQECGASAADHRGEAALICTITD